MKEIGVGLIIRKAAAHLKPTLEVIQDGEIYHWNQYSTFKNTKLQFKLGEEFLDHSPDDRTYKSILTFENGKLVHHQNKIKDSDHSSLFMSWVEDGKLYSTFQSGDVICRREYERE
uniref:Lipocln_cytosolic_FA-bd_dom domain-containing protein n=1 Tax=Caenorhabditis japonica TaxID=281687 RepID=A0A8R1HIJ5_CAEJA